MSDVKRYTFDARAGTLTRYEDGELVPAADYDALAAERDEWRKQVGIGVASQFDEGRKYERRLARLQLAINAALGALSVLAENPRDVADGRTATALVTRLSDALAQDAWEALAPKEPT